jgi:hypothetical protein
MTSSFQTFDLNNDRVEPDRLLGDDFAGVWALTTAAPYWPACTRASAVSRRTS